MGATVIRTSGSEGAICGSASMCDGFLQVFSPPGALPASLREWCFPARRYMRRRGKWWFPTGRAVCAEGGVAVHRGDAKWSCPD